MPLTKQIVACLDVRDGRVVKGKKFKNIQDVSDPLELAKQYSKDGVDVLVLYDITATNEGRRVFVDLIKQIKEEISVPFVVGGGLRAIEDIQTVLEAGATKVSISSAAVATPELIQQAAKKFGKDAIVVAIDAKEVATGKWNVFTKGGKEDSGLDAIEWAKKMERYGAGEIVVNSIDQDGERDGFHIELNQKIKQAINIPIIASGGAGTMEHFRDALQDGVADSALAASVFHYGDIKISALKQYLQKEQINVKVGPTE